MVRINAILSRLGANEPKEQVDILEFGKYILDTKNQKLIFQDDFKTLTSRETELLGMLVTHKNSLCTHKDILTKLWGDNDYFNRKSLNVFITRLRTYLKLDDTLKIENVHGKGFRMVVE